MTDTEINELIKLIVENLSDDLLKKEFILTKNKNRYWGHCYVATEAFYYLLNDDERMNYTPSILKINNITHWFLVNKKTKKVIDITKKQFDFELDYSKSKNNFFLTNKPSKRTLILINRIYEKTGN
jgi:hypothetical protein